MLKFLYLCLGSFTFIISNCYQYMFTIHNNFIHPEEFAHIHITFTGKFFTLLIYHPLLESYFFLSKLQIRTKFLKLFSKSDCKVSIWCNLRHDLEREGGRWDRHLRGPGLGSTTGNTEGFQPQHDTSGCTPEKIHFRMSAESGLEMQGTAGNEDGIILHGSEVLRA